MLRKVSLTGDVAMFKWRNILMHIKVTIGKCVNILPIRLHIQIIKSDTLTAKSVTS